MLAGSIARMGPASEIEVALAWFAATEDAQLRLLVALCAVAALAGIAWRSSNGRQDGRRDGR